MNTRRSFFASLLKGAIAGALTSATRFLPMPSKPELPALWGWDRTIFHAGLDGVVTIPTTCQCIDGQWRRVALVPDGRVFIIDNHERLFRELDKLLAELRGNRVPSGTFKSLPLP